MTALKIVSGGLLLTTVLTVLIYILVGPTGWSVIQTSLAQFVGVNVNFARLGETIASMIGVLPQVSLILVALLSLCAYLRRSNHAMRRLGLVGMTTFFIGFSLLYLVMGVKVVKAYNTDIRPPLTVEVENQNKTDQSPPQSQPPLEKNSECLELENWPDGIRQWCSLILKYASENEINPHLIAAVMLQESGGNSKAYSHSGAVGLLQVMPRDGLAENFMCTAGPCFQNRPTMEELFDPEFNVAYGTRMLSGLIRKTGSVRDALQSYGPMDVGYYYADIVLDLFRRYQ